MERPAAGAGRAEPAAGAGEPAPGARATRATASCTEGGWVALDLAHVRVVLDPAPEDWDLTGTPPEFVAGLDIADPEFEDWIRDQRARFADRLAAVPAAGVLAARRGLAACRAQVRAPASPERGRR